MFKPNTLMLFALVLLCLQLSAFSYSCNNGTFIGNICYCDSGFKPQGSLYDYTSPCSLLSSERQPSTAPAPGVWDSLAYMLSPTMVFFFVRYDYAYEGRKNYRASFNGQCTIPNNNMTALVSFQKGAYDGWGEEVRIDYPLAAVLQCGWVMTQTNTTKTYKGAFEISYTDDLDRGLTKKTTDKFPITFVFPTFVTVTNNLQVQKTEGGVGSLDLFARITSQSVKVETNELTLEMTTQVNYPARVFSVNAVGLPNGVNLVQANPNLALVSSSCPIGSVCTQVWRVTYNLTIYNCAFSGNYKYILDLSCHVSYGGGCPYTGQSINITDSLTSESLCYNKNIGVTASGTLSFHSDSSLSTVKTSFSSETAYAKAYISTTPAAPVSVIVKDIVVNKQYSGQNVFLMADGSTTGNGATANLVQFKKTVGSSFAEVGFSFTPSTFIESGNPSLYQSFTIYVTVQLNFDGGVQRTALIEFKANQQQLSTKLSSTIEVASKKMTSSASIVSFTTYLMLLLAMVVSVFIQ